MLESPHPHLVSLLTSPDLSVSMLEESGLESIFDENPEYAEIWENFMDLVSDYEEFRVALGC